MKSDQWFLLWMTLLGGALTLLSVWIGATLALRGERRSATRERGRQSASALAPVLESLTIALSGTQFATGPVEEQVEEATEALSRSLSSGMAGDLTDPGLSRALGYL